MLEKSSLLHIIQRIRLLLLPPAKKKTVFYVGEVNISFVSNGCICGSSKTGAVFHCYRFLFFDSKYVIFDLSLALVYRGCGWGRVGWDLSKTK